jgi:hypothetical protein
VTEVQLIGQAAPTGAAWPRGDLEDRVVRALDLAATVLDEFGTTGFTDTERPALSFGPDKVIAESAMLAYAAAGAGTGERLTSAVAAVAERLVPLCRSRQALADAALKPHRAFKYAIPHLLLTALGRPDERFDDFIFAQCTSARSMSADLAPVARMEQQWVMGKWGRRAGHVPGRLDVRGTALDKPLDVLTVSREEAYALTHMLFYVSDFARTPAVRLGRAKAAVLDDVRTLVARYVRLEDYDLSGELLMAWPELGAAWDPVSAFCFRVLAHVEDRVGLLPCGNLDPRRVATMSPGESGRYTRASGYHTAFVMGFCCAAALRGDPPARGVLASDRVEAVWPQLYELVGHHRGHWQPVFETLADAEKESMAPMLADMATLDAMEARDFSRAAVVLGLAAQGGIDHPLQQRARAVMTALGRAIDLAQS